MRASRLFMPTLREAPADAELPGHRLLLRGAFIRRLAAGVYSYLPLGLRVLDRIAAIVREEMDAIGGQETLLPALVPQELLEETGRSDLDVLFALRDRSQRRFFLGFTHEEPVTAIVRDDVRSWRQLPLLLYQIQTKFRDEPRPRGGLLRAREFLMKDAYSFDLEPAGLDRVYRAHHQAYARIFARCGLDCLPVEADPGAIGGSENHEFMALADCGEDTVLRCDACGYAANAERAAVGEDERVESRESRIESSGAGDPATRHSALSPQPSALPHDSRLTTHNSASAVVATPGAHTVAQVCVFLGVGPEQIIKTILVTADGVPLAALVRGDRELNLAKLARCRGAARVALADAATVERLTGAPVGFAGPVGLEGVEIYADRELREAGEMVVGANQDDAHRVGVTPGVDFAVTIWADLRVAVAGDPCPQPGCAGHYREARGIEIGHIFQLGTTYSRAMGAQAQGEDGVNHDLLMGCYGLGISRLMAAIAETRHDADGIRWPVSIAPFEVVVLLINPEDEAQRATAETAYAALRAQGLRTLLDEREERPGVKFKDADLIGCPVRVVAGRAAAAGRVEVSLRGDRASARAVPLAEAAACVAEQMARAPD